MAERVVSWALITQCLPWPGTIQVEVPSSQLDTQGLKLKLKLCSLDHFRFVIPASSDHTLNGPVTLTTVSHLCDFALTFSPFCWSCDSLFIPQSPIRAWNFLTIPLKSTCFFPYFSYCMNHIAVHYLAINLTLPLDYKPLRAWTMSCFPLKLLILDFLLHHFINIVKMKRAYKTWMLE